MIILLEAVGLLWNIINIEHSQITRRETNYKQNNGEYVKKTISIERSIPDGIWITQSSKYKTCEWDKWQNRQKAVFYY